VGGIRLLQLYSRPSSPEYTLDRQLAESPTVWALWSMDTALACWEMDPVSSGVQPVSVITTLTELPCLLIALVATKTRLN